MLYSSRRRFGEEFVPFDVDCSFCAWTDAKSLITRARFLARLQFIPSLSLWQFVTLRFSGKLWLWEKKKKKKLWQHRANTKLVVNPGTFGD